MPEIHYINLFQEVNPENSKIDLNTGDLNFSGLAYAGKAINRRYGNIAIDLSNIEIYNKTSGEIPLLWQHDESSPPIGRAKVSFNNDVKITLGTIYNSDIIPNSKAVIELINKKHPLQLSIGVSGKIQRFDKAENHVINGYNEIVDAILTDVKLQEISIVNVPADSETFVEKMNFRQKDDNLKGSYKMPNENQEYIKLANEYASLQQTNIQLAKEATELKASHKLEIEKLQSKVSELENKEKLNVVKEKFAGLSLSEATILTLASLDEQAQNLFLSDLSKISNKTPAHLQPNSQLHNQMEHYAQFSNDKTGEQAVQSTSILLSRELKKMGVKNDGTV